MVRYFVYSYDKQGNVETIDSFSDYGKALREFSKYPVAEIEKREGKEWKTIKAKGF